MAATYRQTGCLLRRARVRHHRGDSSSFPRSWLPPCACLSACACAAAAPCQNFATSLLNLPCLPVGSISIGSIYAALAISALVAPVAIRKFGERMAMIVTSMAYWSYVLSVSYIITPVVLLTSINIGLCGGVSSFACFPMSAHGYTGRCCSATRALA